MNKTFIFFALMTLLISSLFQGFADSKVPDLSNVEWLTLGPFPYSTTADSLGAEYEKDYLTEIGGELKAGPVQSQKTAGKKWLKVKSIDGKVDLGSVYGDQTYCLVYAYLEFVSERSETVALKLGSDDGLKVWVNGSLVLVNNTRRALNPNDDAVRIQLKQGKNRLLLKIVQQSGPWGFAARLRSLAEESLEWRKTTFNGYRICINHYLANSGSINLLVTTIPAMAVKEKVELTLSDLQEKVLKKLTVWTGEPIKIDLPSKYNGVGKILVAGTGVRSGETADTIVMIGNSKLITQENIALARRTVSKTPYRNKGEDIAATLTFLADQLEGKVHPSLINPSRNLRAMQIIGELTQAARGKQWVIGSKRGIRQWAYRSSIDGSCQPYTVYLPEGYSNKRKYSLLVNLHGYSGDDYDTVNNLIQTYRPDDFIIVAPFGRADMAYASIGEQDVLDVIDLIQQTYSIDPDRIYLMGSSMGGCGAWRIGQFYADRFALVAPFCGWTNTKYFSNLSNLPVFIIHGDDDPTVPVDSSQMAASGLKELGYQVRYDELSGVGHNALDSWIAKNGASNFFKYLRRFRRNPWPERIGLTIPYLRFGRHYWARVEDKAIWLEPSQLNTEIVDSRHIVMETINVTAFSLNLTHPKLAQTGRIVININGYNVPVNAGEKDMLFTFSKNRGGFINTKRPSTVLARHDGGGLADLFTGPLYIVYGTNGRSKVLKQAAELLADWTISEANPSGSKVGRFRVIADRDVSEAILKNSNLLCIGTTSENNLTAKLSKKLPVRFSKDKVEVSGRQFKKTGFTYVYYNPDAPTHLVGIISMPFKNKDLLNFAYWLNFNLRAYALDNGVGSFTTPDLAIFSAINRNVWNGSYDLFWKELREK